MFYIDHSLYFCQLRILKVNNLSASHGDQVNTFVSYRCQTSLCDFPVINRFWCKLNSDSETNTDIKAALLGVKHLHMLHKRTRHKKKRANVVSHPLKQLFIEQRLCNRHLRYMSMRNSGGGGHLKGMDALLRYTDVDGWA